MFMDIANNENDNLSIDTFLNTPIDNREELLHRLPRLVRENRDELYRFVDRLYNTDDDVPRNREFKQSIARLALNNVNVFDLEIYGPVLLSFLNEHDNEFREFLRRPRSIVNGGRRRRRKSKRRQRKTKRGKSKRRKTRRRL